MGSIRSRSIKSKPVLLGAILLFGVFSSTIYAHYKVVKSYEITSCGEKPTSIRYSKLLGQEKQLNEELQLLSGVPLCTVTETSKYTLKLYLL